MSSIKFTELNLSSEMLRAIEKMGFTECSPIQAESIPLLMQGLDIIGQAQTGTGKTAAFGIPLIERLDPASKTTDALVLCPTRELAIQVSQELKKLAMFKKINVLPVYGGEFIGKQVNALKRPVQVVVGTPGRIMDHLERGTLRFDTLKTVVLDEADEMLNMGFREDIEQILKGTSLERQTVLFSATMPKPILELTKKFQRNPKLVKVTKKELTVASTEQYYYEMNQTMKADVMARLIDLHNLKLMLVFCNTKLKADEVAQKMQDLGYRAEAIHGDLRQNQRNIVLGKFRRGEINMLVATDVAARGIDVNDVDAVFNYDIPLDPEYYVHRIGRTGRAGKPGKAFSFVTGRNESQRLREIQDYSKVRIEKHALPSRLEMVEITKQKFLTKVQDAISSGKLDEYEKMIQEFMKEGITLHQLTAALLKMQFGDIAPESKATKGKAEYQGEGEERRSYRDKFRKNGNMVRLFISLGRKDRVSKGDIAGGIASLSKIHGEDIGLIDLYDKFSFVEVPEHHLNHVLSSVNGGKIKGRRVDVKIAND